MKRRKPRKPPTGGDPPLVRAPAAREPRDSVPLLERFDRLDVLDLDGHETARPRTAQYVLESLVPSDS